ncbi:M20 family metallo-hydrolase [Aquabacter spiritensis]|uniref:Allantoate deiminase n=1 Tax=Aquabacter spiritensis TaxID=933073 RepID=A0A4R3M2Z4_9HYPH|nr:M20 family metallo-hydrolase [Aquabacter spiritensis]TCT07530.1 allantoate deiminase [Aquabacter spiritensis]
MMATPRPTSREPSPLDGATIEARLKALAAFTDVPGEMTRLTLSPAHKQAAAQVADWFRAAGMEQVHMDATGSIVGRYAADRADARTLIVGSHIDTVRNAGIYDGTLGVLVGVAAVHELHRTGRRLPVAIEVAAFADEEGARFLSTLSSSRAMAGRFDPACLGDVDSHGISRAEALRAFGAPVEALAACVRDPTETLGYVEVHIEQGPVLAAAGLPLGIVTGIAGASRANVRLTGEAAHSGTMPMTMRRDALAAAAEIVLAIEARGARDVAPASLVATVGTLGIADSAVNVVPGEVHFSIDVRASDDEVRRAAVADISQAILAICARRRVTPVVTFGHEAPAALCDPGLRDRLAAAVERVGVAPHFLPSGAGHDAMVFAGVLPMAMLFVRSQNGSHNPREYAAPGDIGRAAAALHAFLLALADDA